MSRLDDAKAEVRGRAPDILNVLGLGNFAQKKPGPCPFCGGRNRYAFTDYRGEGNWICRHCAPKGGDIFDLIGRAFGLSLSETLSLVESGRSGGTIDYTPAPFTPSEPDWNKKSYMEWLWGQGKPISSNDLAALYLSKRGLHLSEFPRSLRFAKQCGTQENDMPYKFPALLARFDSPTGSIVAVQRLFLDAEGRKAPLAEPRKFTKTWQEGCTKGGAVRLHPAGEVMGVCEGVETGLACNLLFDVPIWAACSAGRMINIELPDTVREVCIFADNDENGTGQNAAEKLSARLKSEGRKVSIQMPPETSTDFLDVYIADRGLVE